MQVTFFGVRGSAPAPGPSTLRYGGNTVCVEVRLSDGTRLVLDAGSGLRPLSKARFPADGRCAEPLHLLITHVHLDHICGLPFLTPLWHPDSHIVLHALSREAARRLAPEALFDGEHFPVPAPRIPARVQAAREGGEVTSIGPALVRRVALHHPGGCDGFRIEDQGRTLCYLTDNDLGGDPAAAAALARFAAGADLIIHDAQYLPEERAQRRGYGHSVIDDVLDLGRLAAPDRLALFHHDPDRDDSSLDAIGQRASAWTQEHAPHTQVLVAAEGLTLNI